MALHRWSNERAAKVGGGLLYEAWGLTEQRKEMCPLLLQVRLLGSALSSRNGLL